MRANGHGSIWLSCAACSRKCHRAAYSTGGPPSAHLTGRLRPLGKAAVDRGASGPTRVQGLERSETALKINLRLERFILEEASAVVFLTEGAERRPPGKPMAMPLKPTCIPGACPPHMPQTAYSKEGDLAVLPILGPLEAAEHPGEISPGATYWIKTPIKKCKFDLYGTLDSFSGKLIAGFKHRDVVTYFGKVAQS